MVVVALVVAAEAMARVRDAPIVGVRDVQMEEVRDVQIVGMRDALMVGVRHATARVMIRWTPATVALPAVAKADPVTAVLVTVVQA